MTDDQLNTFLQQFTRAMLDPTAPLPDLWPTGAMGVFLIFVTQIGLGIPSGVLRAQDLGINPLGMAGLYAASDVILAFTVEPMLILLRWLGDRVAFIGRLGTRLARLSGASGLSDGRVRGPLGLILFSFAVSPGAARAALRDGWPRVHPGLDAGHHRRHVLFHADHGLDAVDQQRLRRPAPDRRHRADRRLGAAAADPPHAARHARAGARPHATSSVRGRPRARASRRATTDQRQPQVANHAHSGRKRRSSNRGLHR